jgi:hypothetical protein
MKKILNLVTIASSGIVVFLIIYLIGAFIQVSFDISTWSIDARILVGTLGGLLSFVRMVITSIFTLNQPKQ